MALFDTIVSEAAQRFGLGDKAGSLVSALLSLIAGDKTGGLTGFLDRFRQAGLGDSVSSWVRSGDNTPLKEDQLESALGGDTLRNLAAQADVPLAGATSALSFLIPSIVDKLTPSGVIPASLPSLGSLFSGLTGAAGAAAGAVGGAASAGAHHAAAAASSAASSAADAAAAGGSGLLRLLPLLLLALAAFLGYQYCNRPVEESTRTATVTAPTATPLPAINSSLSLINADGKIKATGVVPDEKTRQEILDKLKATYGEGNFTADIQVNANAKPAGWLAKLGDALAAFKIPGAELNFNGEAITVGGAVAAAGLMDKLKGIFGTGFNLSSHVLDVAAEVKEAAAKTAAALSALAPGASGDELVKALNLNIINFASGKSLLPADNQDWLKKSAAAINAAPAGVKLEVGGHTDNKGVAAGNQKLSQARAEAVRAFLVKQGVKADALVAKGYGAEKPAAPNDTEEGRFRNRRIEFAVIK